MGPKHGLDLSTSEEEGDGRRKVIIILALDLSKEMFSLL
jgi:hypothetical protein